VFSLLTVTVVLYVMSPPGNRALPLMCMLVRRADERAWQWWREGVGLLKTAVNFFRTKVRSSSHHHWHLHIIFSA
jgi:hypothetical protein